MRARLCGVGATATSTEHLCVPRILSPCLISVFAAGRPRRHHADAAQHDRWSGLPTRLPDDRSRAELAGIARPLRRRQGRRDSDAAARGRRVAPYQRPTHAELARPRRAQRAEQAAANPTAPTAARVASNAAALARPARRPPLDLPAPTARPTTHPTADPGPGVTTCPRESPLGLRKNPGRAGRPWPFRRRLDSLADLEKRGHRSGIATGRSDLATVSSPRRPPRSSRSTSPTSTPSSYAASTSSS